MNVFEAVKQTVTTRQAAEMYGIRVNRHGMAVCPFHNDKNPSMKVDMRFHCFACQADGDAVDFVSRLFGLPSKEAAMKLADDFGIYYDSRQKPSVRPKSARLAELNIALNIDDRSPIEQVMDSDAPVVVAKRERPSVLDRLHENSPQKADGKKKTHEMEVR